MAKRGRKPVYTSDTETIIPEPAQEQKVEAPPRPEVTKETVAELVKTAVPKKSKDIDIYSCGIQCLDGKTPGQLFNKKFVNEIKAYDEFISKGWSLKDLRFPGDRTVWFIFEK